MSEEVEEWRPVKGLEAYYKVSNTGLVFSVRTNRLMKPFLTKFGYKRLSLQIGPIKVKRSVHRLVAEAFIPNPEGKPQVHHIDNDPGNNNSVNLKWGTAKENIQYAAQLGRLKCGKGSNNSMANLTEDIVLEIRRLAGSKKYKQRQIADMFGLDERHVSLIILRKRWKHI